MTAGFREEKVTFDIVDHLGMVGTPDRDGFQKEVNIVSWNGRKPKVDIRAWNAEHTRMRNGIRLTEEEAEDLMNVLNNSYNGAE